jgi:hypothetical protein
VHYDAISGASALLVLMGRQATSRVPDLPQRRTAVRGNERDSGRTMKTVINVAAKSPVGLAPDDLTVGQLVTLSPNKATGDRSLVDAIWEIIGINEGHLLLACRGFCDLLIDPEKPRLALVHEHEFYSATQLAAVADSPSSRPQ